MNQVYIKISENYTATIRDLNSLKNHPDLKPNKITKKIARTLEIVDVYHGTSKKFIKDIENIIGAYKKLFAPDSLEIYINQAFRFAKVINAYNQGILIEYSMPNAKTYKGFLYWNKLWYQKDKTWYKEKYFGLMPVDNYGKYISYSKIPKSINIYS